VVDGGWLVSGQSSVEEKPGIGYYEMLRSRQGSQGWLEGGAERMTGSDPQRSERHKQPLSITLSPASAQGWTTMHMARVMMRCPDFFSCSAGFRLIRRRSIWGSWCVVGGRLLGTIRVVKVSWFCRCGRAGAAAVAVGRVIFEGWASSGWLGGFWVVDATVSGR
jgi:hypothetical protein